MSEENESTTTKAAPAAPAPKPKKMTRRAKPKAQFFYKRDAAGVHLFMSVGKSVIWLCSHRHDNDYVKFITENVKDRSDQNITLMKLCK